LTVNLPLPEDLAKLLPEGTYTVQGFLGQGGMGAVYRGTQVRLQRQVAIKIMCRDQGKDHGFEERFRREALALAQLNHPNIVNVIDYGEAGPDYLYIVMEFVDGTDLVGVIRSGQMTQETALKLLPQICDALQFAHDNGIVHRDIKPANILLTRDGRIKMADFGLAKRFDVNSTFHTQTGAGMGTPDYAAPEQFDPHGNVDHRADIYALGVMIYQMVTGQLPRGAWKPPSEKADVDAHWDKIVSHALQTDPSDRYTNVSEIKTDISSISLPVGGQDAVTGSAVSRDRRVSGKVGGSTTVLTQAGGRSAAVVQAPAPPRSKKPLVFGLTGTLVLSAAVGFLMRKKEEPVVVEPVVLFASRTWTPPAPTVTAGTEWTNLIPHIKPDRDAIRGEWAVDEKGLHAKRAEWAMCNFPVQDPGTDYDLRYKVTRGEGSHLAMFFAFRKGGTGGYVPIDYIGGGAEFADGQRLATLEDLTHLDMRDAATIKAKRKEWLPRGKACTVLIQVREKEVIVSVNDEEAFRWPAEWSKLQQKGGAGGSMFLDVTGGPIFGVGIFNCEAVFHSIEMRKVNSVNGTPPPHDIAIGNDWTDLVPHVKLDRDVVRGDWKSVKDGLACVNLVKWSLCKLPVKQPQGDYEMRCRLTRTGGPVDGLFFPFRWGNTGGSIGIDYPGLLKFDGLRRAGLERIEGRDLKTPSDMVAARKEWIPMGKTCTVLLQVGAKEVRLTVDDIEAVRWKADWSQIRQTGNITPWGGVFAGLSGPIFGVGMFNSEVVYHSIEMRKVPAAPVGEPGSIPHLLTSPDYEWTAPVNLGPLVNSPNVDLGPMVSPDGLHLVFSSLREGDAELFECRRPSADEPWSKPSRVFPAIEEGHQDQPWMSPDELRLIYHATTGPGHHGKPTEGDIYFRHRPTRDQPWPPPVNLGAKINHPGHDVAVRLSNDERTLLFTSTRPGGQGTWDVWQAKRTSREALFGQAENMGPGLNTADADFHATFAADDRTLLFLRGSRDLNFCRLFMATPDAKGQYQTTALDFPISGKLHNPWLSADGRTLWFAWNGPGSLGDMDLWEIRRVPKAKKQSAAAGGSSTSPGAATKEAPFENSLGMKFVPVPGTNVLFCTHETRVHDYTAFDAEEPDTEGMWRLQHHEGVPVGREPDHPVVGVTWEDARRFCDWLGKKEGRTYRLPTDREWSFAAGIAAQEPWTEEALPEQINMKGPDRFEWGVQLPPPAGFGNFADMSCKQQFPRISCIDGYKDGFPTTAPVGRFQPNQIGLYDMLGNAAEWCEDWFEKDRVTKVLRGQCWRACHRTDLLLTARMKISPKSRTGAAGFRCVLVPGEEK
jgi:hypothetical protein